MVGIGLSLAVVQGGIAGANALSVLGSALSLVGADTIGGLTAGVVGQNTSRGRSRGSRSGAGAGGVLGGHNGSETKRDGGDELHFCFVGRDWNVLGKESVFEVGSINVIVEVSCKSECSS